MGDSAQQAIVIGATGFIGRHLLRRLKDRTGITVHALTRRIPEKGIADRNRLHWVYGDLVDAAIPNRLMVPDATLINLAFPQWWDCAAHVESTKRLADAAAEKGVQRVIHCSTAVVVGNTFQQRVTEATDALPQTEYEKTKLVIEDVWRTCAAGRFDLVIMRPSAIFGPGGKNLVKLADALTCGSRLINYWRSVLYSRRKMNLVCVGNVVAAIEALFDREEPFSGDIFNVADDDDPFNNFRDVERILMREFGMRDYAPPRFSAPPVALATLLRLTGRSNSNPERVYDCTKLQQIGWRRDYDIEQGLRDFAAWYLSQQRGT